MVDFILNLLLWTCALYGLIEIIKNIYYIFSCTNLKTDGISLIVACKNQENNIKENQNTEDENWIDEVNQTIEIKRTDEYFEKEKNKEKKVKTKKKQANSAKNIPTNTENEENRDLWPDDWEDE